MNNEPNISPYERVGEALDGGEGGAISLSLEDLLPDSAGCIVIEGDVGNLTILLATDHAVVAQGLVSESDQTTGTPAELAGHAFFAFDHGLTVFYPTEVQLSIVSTGA